MNPSEPIGIDADGNQIVRAPVTCEPRTKTMEIGTSGIRRFPAGFFHESLRKHNDKARRLCVSEETTP